MGRGRTALHLALIAAFVTLGIVLVLHHEPWRDEADPWLMARDAPLAEVFRRAGYVGTPMLWTYVLAPLARLGLPYPTLGFVNLAFAAAAAALVIAAAPLPLLTRVLLAFSFYLSYEYAAVARSYALAVALLFAIATLDSRRDRWPRAHGALIALLFNTNVHGMALALPILALRTWELVRRRRGGPAEATTTGDGLAWQGLAIAVIGGIAAAVQIVPPADGQLQGLSHEAGLRWVPVTLAGALFPSQEENPAFMTLAALIWFCVAVSLARRPRALVFLISSSLLLWAIFALKYPGYLRHWGFLLLALIYALWTARAEEGENAVAVAIGPRRGAAASRKAARARGAGTGPRGLAGAAPWAGVLGLNAALAWSAWFGYRNWMHELGYPFSESRAMARYLIEQRLTGTPIAAWPAPYAEAVLPYLPVRRFYYPGIRDSGSYMKWDRTYESGLAISGQELVDRVDQAYPPGRDVLLLTNQPVPEAEAAGFALLHAADGNAMMQDERYLLYARGAAASPSRVPTPPPSGP